MPSGFLNKRIAILSPSFPPDEIGGIATAHYHLYRLLKANRFSVRVFTFDSRANFTSANPGVYYFGLHPLIKVIIKRAFNLLFKFLDPGTMAFQASYCFIPIIPILQINYYLQKFKPDFVILPDQGAPGLFLYKRKNTRWILISHNNPSRFTADKRFGNISVKDARLAVYLEDLVLKKVDWVLCPSRYMKSVFHKTYLFSGPVTVINNLIDIETIQRIPAATIKKKMDLADNNPLIYIPSAGSEFKGAVYVPDLIMGLSSVKRNKMGFYLSGKIPQWLMEIISNLPKYIKIYCPGQTDNFTNISIVKTCSFGITPTLAENFSMAILEANFCGLPMVAFDTGGVPEIIKNKINGFLVPRNHISELISKSSLLLNPKILKPMKIRTLKYVSGRFSTEAISRDYLQLFKEKI